MKSYYFRLGVIVIGIACIFANEKRALEGG